MGVKIKTAVELAMVEYAGEVIRDCGAMPDWMPRDVQVKAVSRMYGERVGKRLEEVQNGSNRTNDVMVCV